MRDGYAAVQDVAIGGPFGTDGPGDTPSRRRIFTCQAGRAADEMRCARRIVSTLARRAYRRPVTDGDVETLLEFYRSGRAEGTFETGIQSALERLLISPDFLFRVERDPAKAAPASADRLAAVVLPLEQHSRR
jgi:hypothetical protein